ncbi:hypothetical protein [Arthrobacter sp. PM3]|nr:hypothetical protein [Arthrobacter sp. PM3]
MSVEGRKPMLPAFYGFPGPAADLSRTPGRWWNHPARVVTPR